MKLLGALILFIILLGSALAENKVEFHADHEAADSHSSDLTFHSTSHEKTTKKSTTTDGCDHYHVHCSNLCLGVLIPTNQQIHEPASALTEIRFVQPHLLLKDFSNSLYRPPIA